MRWIPRWGSLWMAISSVSDPFFVPAFPLERNHSGLKILRWVGGPFLQLWSLPMHWIWSLQVQNPLCWVFQLMSSHLGPGELLLSWHLGLSSGYSQFHTLQCYTPPFNFLTLSTSPLSPPTSNSPLPPISPPTHPLSLSGPSLPLLPFIIFLLSKTEASTVLLVRLHVVCELYLGDSKLWG